MSSDPPTLSPPRRPLPDPIQPQSRHANDDSDDDVYRGEPPVALHPSRSYESLAESSSSSSSSFSFLAGGRLGAIATVVEHAISRWARRRSSSSSTSSSSSSSATSIITLTRSQISRHRRRRRHLSTGNLRSVRSVQSDLVLERTITDLKAREELRQIPREFALYLPPSLRRHNSRAELGTPQPVTRTTSLPLITTRLDFALRKTLKARRKQERPRWHKTPSAGLSHRGTSEYHDYMLPEAEGAPMFGQTGSTSQRLSQNRKGKIRDGHVSTPSATTRPSPPLPKAWWLDVSNPDWDDIRAIGQLLHLHPLTLEDIFQQEPREKLEIFPRLGYYFIAFRAIESQATQEKIQRAELHSGQGGGIIGEAIVFLVVFEEGICTFHFADISEHTNRVINRILLLEEASNMSSDWIAHGMLDSIVDSFFPVLEKVEKEVSEIENLVFFPQEPSQGSLDPPANDVKSDSTPVVDEEKYSIESKETMQPYTHPNIARPKIRFSVRLDPRLVYRRLKRLIRSRTTSKDDQDKNLNQIPSPLQRMAKARRLVTTLTRLLGSKSEVVSQLRKRLVNGVGTLNEKPDDEVAIYMGDVHDHILSLQHSLAHYERMLSQSHPAYLAQLRAEVAKAKSGNDKAIMYLTIISIGVLCLQALFGMFSLNVEVPGNERAPGEPFTVFGELIAASAVIVCAYLSIVRRWWVRAKKRRRTVL